MGRASKVDRLDPRLKALVDEKLASAVTLDEILDAVRALGGDVSRSSLGRYKQRVDQVAEKLKAVQDAAESLVAPLRASRDGEQVELIAQMLQSILFRIAMAHAAGDDVEDELGPKELMFLAKTAKELQSARKVDVDRQMAAARLEERRETARRAAEKVEEIARAADAPQDRAALLKRIREEIYGIVE